jgi:site-specific recombinase XerD
MTPTDFAEALTRFLGQYLPAQRAVSPHTISAYRDTFTLLLRYCRDVQGIPTERLRLQQVDAPLILNFLNHLEQERQCQASTRNYRLAALHAFFRYVQTEDPKTILQCQRILAIPLKRCPKPIVTYLLPDDLKAILSQPDLNTPNGRRDAVLLSLLYDTGARVQEIIDLSVGDVRLQSPAQVKLHGKGRKMRAVPLMEPTVHLLQEYMQERQLNLPECTGHPLFFNRSGFCLSRFGIRYILQKYNTQAKAKHPQLKETISPHVLRHSKAMHLLQAGVPLIIIRNILGHADVKATEVYAKADLEMKRRALEKIAHISPNQSLPSWQTNKELLDWLKSL